MKGIKGKFLKKLKSIRPLSTLRIDRVLQVHASDGLSDPFRPNHGQAFENLPASVQPAEIIDVEELMRDLCEEDEEDAPITNSCNKENIRPAEAPKNLLPGKENDSNTEICSGSWHSTPFSSFRRPDLTSGCLFDPNLLAAFQQTLTDKRAGHEPEKRSKTYEPGHLSEDDEPPENPLLEFEERCPPEGIHSVILYTTTIRGIRKTFEDCSVIKFLLESLKVLYHERDVSMHLEFREELWRIMGGRILPPRLFIKGRYIGGADEVLGLHERGQLKPLVADIPLDRSGGTCHGCSGMRFVMCSECNGSHKLAAGVPDSSSFIKCPHCNENGLVVCPICC